MPGPLWTEPTTTIDELWPDGWNPPPTPCLKTPLCWWPPVLKRLGFIVFTRNVQILDGPPSPFTTLNRRYP